MRLGRDEPHLHSLCAQNPDRWGWALRNGVPAPLAAWQTDSASEQRWGWAWVSGVRTPEEYTTAITPSRPGQALWGMTPSEVVALGISALCKPPQAHPKPGAHQGTLEDPHLQVKNSQVQDRTGLCHDQLPATQETP